MSEIRREVDRLEGRRSTAVWGTVAGLVVVASLFAYLVYAYGYLAVSTDRWPPEPHPDPPLLAPAALLAVLLASGIPAARLGRPVEAGVRRWTVEVLTAVLVATGIGVLLAGDAVVDGLHLVPSERAYDAAVASLHAFMGAVTAAGVTIAAVTGWESHRLGTHPWVATASVVTAIWWEAVIVGWATVALVVYASPQLT